MSIRMMSDLTVGDVFFFANDTQETLHILTKALCGNTLFWYADVDGTTHMVGYNDFVRYVISIPNDENNLTNKPLSLDGIKWDAIERHKNEKYHGVSKKPKYKIFDKVILTCNQQCFNLGSDIIFIVESFHLDVSTGEYHYDLTSLRASKPLRNVRESELVGYEELKKRLEEPIKVTSIFTKWDATIIDKDIKNKIVDVQFNEKKKATTIILDDGRKGIAKCTKGDEYDKYIGFAIALQNALFGSKTQAKKFIDEAYNKQSTKKNKGLLGSDKNRGKTK